MVIGLVGLWGVMFLVVVGACWAARYDDEAMAVITQDPAGRLVFEDPIADPSDGEGHVEGARELGSSGPRLA